MKVPVKNALAPLAGLTMAVIAAGCLVIFSLVASNTVYQGAPRTNAARPQEPPGGGDGAVTIALPENPPGTGGDSTSSEGSEALALDEITAPGEVSGESDADGTSGESIAAGAVADFFGGAPDEVIVSRVTARTGIPNAGEPSSRPGNEPPGKERPASPAGDGGPYCPPSKIDKAERGTGNPHGGPPACGNPHGEPPGYDNEREGSPSSGKRPDAPSRSGGGDSPPRSEHKDPPTPASPSGRSGQAKDGHPHGESPGQSGNGGKSSRGGGHPHGGPPGHDGGSSGQSGGHQHGGPPGQAKK